MKMFRV